MRSEAEIEEVFRNIQSLRRLLQRISQKEMNGLCKSSGVNGESLLLSRSALIPYRSVPLDYMLPLLINIVSRLVDLIYEEDWMAPEKQREIEATFLNFGSGVTSETCRPRPLRQRGMFKAGDWEFFLLQSSVVASSTYDNTTKFVVVSQVPSIAYKCGHLVVGVGRRFLHGLTVKYRLWAPFQCDFDLGDDFSHWIPLRRPPSDNVG